MKKIVTFLTSLLLIGGCANSGSSTVIFTDSDNNVLSNYYQAPIYIHSKSKLIDTTNSNIGKHFTSYQEKETFNNELKAKKSDESEDYVAMIEYLDAVQESAFENYNLIFTSDMSLKNESFSHSFEGLIMQGDLLTIKVIYTNALYNYSMQTVTDTVYDLYAVFVRKEVKFRMTTTTIETKLYK